MKDDVYARILYIIHNTKGSKIIPNRECFKILKEVFPNISDYTIGSIYSLEYMRKMKKNHFKISKIADKLHDRYNAAVKEGQPEGILLRMSDEIDLSPALLARLVVQQRYSDKLENKIIVFPIEVPDSNSAQGPGKVVSEVPPIVDSVKESMTYCKALEANTENANLIPALNLKKENVLVVREAPPTSDSTKETVQNGTLPETKDKTVNIPASNGMDKTMSIVGDGSSSGDLETKTIKNALWETKIESTIITSSKFTEDVKSIVSNGSPYIESTTETMKDSLIEETKAEIEKHLSLNCKDYGALVVKKAPSSINSVTEMMKNTMSIKTKTETTNTSELNSAIPATVLTPRESEQRELKKEDESLADEKEPPPKLTVTRLMKNPKLIDDPNLAIETFLCTLHDDQYGPLADCIKHSLGQEYEMRLVRMARAAGMIFSNEGHLRTTGFDKTPDVKLDVPIIVDGFIVNWIESKALFGDEEAHKGYINEQYQCYCNRFGTGLVIYWFGFLDKLNFRNQDQFLLADDFPKNFSLLYVNQ